MNNANQIRQLLKTAKTAVDGAIVWSKFPIESEAHSNRALDILSQILALLPCETCNGSGQIADPMTGNLHMLTLMPCPDCKENNDK